MKLAIVSAIMFLQSLAFAASSGQEQQQPVNPLVYGSCEILMTNDLDNANRYCPEGFGVTYLGHKIDALCYLDLDAAIRVMRATETCMKSERLNACELLFPFERDANSRYCKSSFGVIFNGVKINNLCYTTVDQAYAVMAKSAVCQ